MAEEAHTLVAEPGRPAKGPTPPHDPHNSAHELFPDQQDKDSQSTRLESCFGAFDRDGQTFSAKPETVNSAPSEPCKCSGSTGTRLCHAGNISQTQDAALLTPTPAALAHLLTSLQPSATAVQLESAQDPYVASRLASAAVLLFRAGRGQEAEMLGQFGVDVLGARFWSQYVGYHLAATPELDDVIWAYPLVENVVEELKKYDEESYSKAMELEGMVPG